MATVATDSLYIVTTPQLVPVLVMTKSHDMQCCHDVTCMLMNNSLVPIADILHYAWCVCICPHHLAVQLSKTMGGVVKGLDKVMQTMDLEKVCTL